MQATLKQHLALICAVVGAAIGPRAAFAAEYEVGEGQAYTALGDVPFESLQPGDEVRIHWRAAPYREKILLSSSGTADHPIRITGVPGPNGELPILDGQDAQSRTQSPYLYVAQEARGVLIVSTDTTRPAGYKPAYLTVEGLELRNASVPGTFTDTTGNARPYLNNAAALFVERGEHVVVRNCTLDGSGNGFFVASGGDESTVSRDILVDGCRIFGNGNPGRSTEHNLYTEADGTVIQNCSFGHLRPGSPGNNVKDRSAGTVIRYNTIDGGAHALDLVESQGGCPILCQEPSYRETFVYGNVILNGPQDAGYLFHYGGDSGPPSTYRKGHLYFAHNTIVVRSDLSGAHGRYRTVLFDLSTNDESLDVRNNIFYTAPATPGASPTHLEMLNQHGTADFGANRISPGWTPWRDGTTPDGTILDMPAPTTDPNNDPGFVDLGGGDLHLRSGSPGRGAGQSLPAVWQSVPDVSPYLLTGLIPGGPATPAGAIDLGAFQSAVSGGGNPTPRAPGDIDGDGAVTLKDAVLAVEIAIGTITPTPEQEKAGDVNGDGRINLQDATLLLMYVVGLLSKLPG